jgi:hypothetical protein
VATAVREGGAEETVAAGPRRVLRLGCIVDEQPPCEGLLDLVERSRRSGEYSVELLIVQAPATRCPGGPEVRGSGRRDGFAGLAAAACFSMISALEGLIVRALTGFAGKISVPELRIPEFRIRPVAEGDGRRLSYRPEDVARLKSHRLDVLVRFERSGTLAGEILGACPFGILSLERAGPQAGLEGPPGFWEVVHRSPSTAFAIEHRSGVAPEGQVLFAGAINTAPLYRLNAVNLLRKSRVFMHRFLLRLARDRQLPPAISPGRPRPCRHAAPPLRAQARYLARTSAHVLERAARRSIGIRWRWGVAYQFAESWRTAELSRSIEIANPPRRYFADPCVVHWQGAHVCFVEDYDRRLGRARITALGIDADGHEELGVALEEPFHLSYPFVFEAGGELYMCPETEQAREIRLYKCVQFPLRWRLHRVLMKGVAAVDTSIFRHQGRWWMLTNLDSAETGDYRSELHVFHADAFDSEQWRPHPGNPVVFDSARARNGGFIREGGAIYRVFQVQGFDAYGESMGVARIDELSGQRYAETPVAAIRPDFLPGIAGTHSLSADRGLLALDFVRRQRL